MKKFTHLNAQRTARRRRGSTSCMCIAQHAGQSEIALDRWSDEERECQDDSEVQEDLLEFSGAPAILRITCMYIAQSDLELFREVLKTFIPVPPLLQPHRKLLRTQLLALPAQLPLA